MKLAEEFKAFSMKGNVTDMAVGIIIGAAFGKIIASVVSDVIMPPIGLVIGGVNFTDLKFVMKAAVGDNPAAPPAPTKEETLLTEIRDLLKK